MNRIIKIEQTKESPFYLTWIINNICTNQCSYCPSDLHSGQNHHYNWDNAKRFFDLLFQKYGKVYCSIAGGEPSVSPFLPEIVKTFYEKGSGVNITTNGAKSVDYWKDISKYLSSINFSWHPQFVDKKFLDKVLVSAKNTRVNVRIMMYKDYWQEAVGAFNLYKEITDIDNITPVRIHDWGGNEDTSAHIYNEEQLEWFKQNTPVWHNNNRPLFTFPGMNLKFYFENGDIISNPNIVAYINQGYTNFFNYKCEVGIKHLYVTYRGDVYRGNCLVGGQIGHINNPETIQWPVKPILCNKRLCDCSTDVIINKWI